MILIVCSVTGVSGGEVTVSGAPTAVQTLAPLVRKIMPTVVSIRTIAQSLEAYPATGPGSGFPDGPLPTTREGVGAGVVVDADRGLVLTSGHVVKNTDTISVLLTDGRRFTGSIVVADEETDLAVLRIEATDLIAGSIGEVEGAQPGDFVLAIGDPLGLENSVTFGIISALHRSWPAVQGHDLIQTDLLLGRGSSGGPLFNLRGEIIGINVARASYAACERNVGFATPASAVAAVLLRARKAHQAS